MEFYRFFKEDVVVVFPKLLQNSIKCIKVFALPLNENEMKLQKFDYQNNQRRKLYRL
jgi:hypothetical protein